MTALTADRGKVSSKVAGLTVALALHGAALWTMTAFQDPATSSFEGGSGGLTVMIGESGGAPDIGEVSAAQVEGVQEGVAEEAVLEQAPPVETLPVETLPVDAATETIDPRLVEVVEPEPAMEPQPAALPVPAPTESFDELEPVERIETVATSRPADTETVAVEAESVPVESADIPDMPAQPVETITVQDVPPPPVPQARPKPVEIVTPVPADPLQAVKPAETELAEVLPAPQTVMEKASTDAAPAEERAEAQQKKGGEFDAAASAPTQSTHTGTLQASSGAGGATGARMSYLASLQSWLEQHKRYPRAARLRRYEGTVEFRFLIDRSGSVLEQAIVESSGRRILDEAVLELLKRASPLPSMPPEVGGATLELTTSIDFRLR